MDPGATPAAIAGSGRRCGPSVAWPSPKTRPRRTATGRPVRRVGQPQARIVAAALDLTFSGLALLWSGAFGLDQAFGNPGAAPRQVVRLLVCLAVLVAPMLMEAAGGQTFGKRIVGIRVVSRVTGGPIPLHVAVHRGSARALFWFVSFLALGDPLMQQLHDRSAGTVVIDARAYGWVPRPG